MVLMQILKFINKNPAKIRNGDRKFSKQLKFKGVTFSLHKKDYVKIEKKYFH